MKKSALVLSGVAVLGLVTVVMADDRSPRGGKVQGVGFHQVSPTSASGYNQVTFDGQTYFVAPTPLISPNQINSVQAQGGSLTIGGTIAASSKITQLAVMIDGQLVGVGSASLQNGQATISGLSTEQTQRVSHLLSRKSASPNGPAFTVTSAGMSNGEYVFDVFVQNVPNLRTYQVKLQATGGTSGALNMTDVRIDESRPDFVFAEEEAIKAADHGGSRLGGTLFNISAVEVNAPKYVGTWKFRPTPDAAGMFQIQILTNGESFISNAQNENIPIHTVDASVQIGGKARLSD